MYLRSLAPKRDVITEITPAKINESPSPKVSVLRISDDIRLNTSNIINEIIIPYKVYKIGAKSKLHFVIPNL